MKTQAHLFQVWSSFCQGPQLHQVGKIEILEPLGTPSVRLLVIKAALKLVIIWPPFFSTIAG